MKHWYYVQEQLNLAMAVLPTETHPLVQNHIDNNELQLAMEAMEKLAEDHVAGSEAEACFWRPMAKAAILMVEPEEVEGMLWNLASLLDRDWTNGPPEDIANAIKKGPT